MAGMGSWTGNGAAERWGAGNGTRWAAGTGISARWTTGGGCATGTAIGFSKDTGLTGVGALAEATTGETARFSLGRGARAYKSGSCVGSGDNSTSGWSLAM